MLVALPTELTAYIMAETGRTAEEMGIAGPLVLYLPGVLFPLTNIGIGLMLARSRPELRWQGLVLVLAVVLFPVSRIGFGRASRHRCRHIVYYFPGPARMGNRPGALACSLLGLIPLCS